VALHKVAGHLLLPDGSVHEYSWVQGTANKMSTFIMSGAVCGFGSILSGHKISGFKQNAYISWEPDEYAPSGSTAYNDASSFPDPYTDAALGQRHGKLGGAVMVVSGSVEFVKRKTWVELARSSTANSVWCVPGSTSGR